LKDPIAIVEASYAFEAADEQAWLSRVAGVVRSNLPSAGGALAYAFSIENRDSLPWITPRSFSGEFTPELAQVMFAPPLQDERAQRVFQIAAAAYYRTPGLRSGLAFVDSEPELAAISQYYRKGMEGLGLRDVLTLVAADPTSEGCVVALPMTGDATLTAGARARWQRLAAHLSAGCRLRRKMASMPAEGDAETAEAILSPSGKLEHATGEAAAPSARERFREAVLRSERARGALRRRDPNEAVTIWQGLVQGRWSLVDRFERDGRRYVVAHRNDPEVPDPRALTARERQVLGYAALGQSNKLIAYELGLSPSTVGVLLSRAAAKLRTRSRAELVATVKVGG
jgi:DNA-binding CsgD family transcriptional regulator